MYPVLVYMVMEIPAGMDISQYVAPAPVSYSPAPFALQAQAPMTSSAAMTSPFQGFQTVGPAPVTQPAYPNYDTYPQRQMAAPPAPYMYSAAPQAAPRRMAEASDDYKTA